MNFSVVKDRRRVEPGTILGSWVACFFVATSWEVAFRILVEYSQWNQWDSLSYMGRNVAFAVACSLILGTFHWALLALSGRIEKVRSAFRVLLWPEFGIATATLLGMVIWVLRYRLPLQSYPFIIQLIVALLITAAAYYTCMRLARLVHRYVLSRLSRSFLIKIIAGLAFGPIVIVFLVQWVRSSNHLALNRPDNSATRIVLISVDTLRCDFLSTYGSPHVRTPVIDQIATEGARFDNAVCPMPLTGPSHMSMLTGLSPLIHGVFMNGFLLPKKIPTLTSILRKEGFRTGGFISGWPLQIQNSRLHPGFQKYDDNIAWIDYFGGAYSGRFVSKYFKKDLSKGARTTTDSALKWLRTNFNSPFFLFVHYYDPHYPYGGGNLNSHDKQRSKPEELPYQKQLYGSEVATVDAQIGRLIAFLKEKNIYDSTLLIFTADHGENLGEHGYYYEHKSLYEPVIRVPLILRYPQKVRPGTVIQQQVPLTDIFQTILKAASVKSAQAPDSLDLVGIANHQAEQNERVMIINNFRRKLVKHSVRTLEWKLIRNDDLQRSYELYHLPTDPHESRNLYPDKKEIAHKLESLLNRQLGIQVSNEVEGLSPEQIESLKALGYFN
ncbi:sulfatase-like hydrolase/transferase [bacterium]|nr:sulfatase-like hydrolase/transferase [bacterium]